MQALQWHEPDVPSVKTTRYDLKSFRYFSTKLWNELPNHIRLEQNLNQFSKLLNTWNGKANLCIHKTQLHIKLIRTESKSINA
jgi:hypothetical protein